MSPGPEPSFVVPGPLVDAPWLAAHLDEVLVADVRWSLGGGADRAGYAAGHLPGAVFVDLDADLAAPSSPEGGRHPLPTPEAFADAMGRLGIGDDAPVVAYDDAGGSIAARLWWMLDAIGHRAAVLDGGLAAWTGPLEAGPVTPHGARFTSRLWPEDRFVGTDAVDGLRSDPGALLVDARTAARFRGEDTSTDPRPGHVPGSTSAPWADNLGADGRFRPPTELRERFAALGADAADVVVASCGSGVTACHDLLALRLAGIGPTRLYVGSWSAWSADPDRDVATSS